MTTPTPAGSPHASTESIRAVAQVPDRPSVDGLEQKWATTWAEQNTYAFDRRASRDQVFSIDTPPPTVSGALHIGHSFSYTHTDIEIGRASCRERLQKQREAKTTEEKTTD